MSRGTSVSRGSSSPDQMMTLPLAAPERPAALQIRNIVIGFFAFNDVNGTLWSVCSPVPSCRHGAVIDPT